MPERADSVVAVIVPAYQAATTVGGVVAGARHAAAGARLYVVDDGSGDATADVARAFGAVVLSQPRNRGKGAALASGFARALDDGATIVVTLDADGQHDPAAIPDLVAPVAAAEADLTLGARARTGRMPFGRRLTNRLSAALASRVAGVTIPDAQTGFRAVARRVIEAVQPGERRYDFETAFLLGALAAGFRVQSVPVPTHYGWAARSHFHPWSDTWRVARVFARYGGRILAGGR